MKSDICKLDGDKADLSAIFVQVEKTAAYEELDKKSALQLRLLAEELVGMLPELLDCVSGEFWIECEDKKFELHASLRAASNDLDFNEKVMALSTSGKNIAAKGIMGKIAATVMDMLHIYTSPEVQENIGYYSMGMGDVSTTSPIWSLNNYRDSAESFAGEGKTEAWDELEKSIVAKIADDVEVGIRGEKVDIIITKKFPA